MVCSNCKYALMVALNDSTDIPYSLDGKPAIKEYPEQILFYEGKVEK